MATTAARDEPEDDAKLVLERCHTLLCELPPATTDAVTFLGRQFDLGLAWVHFPVGCGGLDVSPDLQAVASRALLGAGAPDPSRRNPIGYGMAAPTIAVHGTDAQRRRFLRPLFTGEEIWCQLFSEPGAGSDLASVATLAQLDGDEWIVNGQKVWTTIAHEARWGTLLARTDPDVPKHRGLSYFIVDMESPGVEVKPLCQLTGDAEFNEVFLTDARVADTYRLGERGDGWRVAVTTLMNERTAVGDIADGAAGVINVDAALREWRRRGGTPVERDHLVQLWIEARVAQLTMARARETRAAGTPGPEGSLGKMLIGELNKRLTSFVVALLGPEGMLKPEGYSMRSVRFTTDVSPQHAFLRARANSIEGGTTEIAKNVVAERVLGLPSDVRIDKDVAWRDVPRS